MKNLLVLLFVFVLQVFALNVQDRVQTKLNKGENVDVFIIFKEQVDFKSVEKTLHVKLDEMDEDVRGRLVVDSLKAVATHTQKDVIKFLKANNFEYHSFYISNTISVQKANLALLKGLKSFPEIESIDMIDMAYVLEDSRSASPLKQTVEDGVKYVHAPELWAKGYKGQGITVGVIDTGVFANHSDLKNYYRGRDGNHEDSWLDATRDNKKEPYDDHFHGTHCHGTVHANGTTETVGVAPESEWVSCKFLTRTGGGNYNDCLKCFEFMLAPGGKSEKRPHVVSNSYGGGQPTSALRRALDHLLDAGVEMVFAAGNSGPRCSSILAPALYPEALSVGALNKNSNTLARFSSRGPGQNRDIKPEIVAPGSNVRSTAHTGGYRSASGTSMACPHVAGVIALLWSAHHDLKRNIGETRRLLYRSATDVNSRECNSPQHGKNNLYGHGVVNALKAYRDHREEKVKAK